MRRRSLVGALLGSTLAGCLERARTFPVTAVPDECVENPATYYGEEAFTGFDRVGNAGTGPPYYGGAAPIERTTTVPLAPPG